MHRFVILGLALALPIAAQAQAQQEETIETLASEDEAKGVQDAVGRVNCRAQAVEKESDTLYEVDDAECDIGQYDIKLDDKFNVISMTRDE
jgi:flagellar basal body rod protein FlgF